MCLFSGQVDHVGSTRIFCRGEGARQLLVYQMHVASPRPVAMILPVPVAPGSGEHALRFVDLQRYDAFFDDLAAAFPQALAAGAPRGSFGGPAARAPLVVHTVGAFEASYVPTLADFGRLDPRFRLAPDVWTQLPRYADFGFAVFQLAAASSPQSVHPMAFEFPRRDPRALYFPTTHVHDGRVHATALFDHDLYAQPGGALAATLAWERTDGPLGANVDATRAAGVIDPGAPVSRLTARGFFQNDDVVIVQPDVERADEAMARGASFRLPVRTRSGFGPFVAAADASHARRFDTAQLGVSRLRAAFEAALVAWESTRAATWGLTTWERPAVELDEVYAYTAPAEGSRVQMVLRPPSIDEQRIGLAFAARPPSGLAFEKLRRELETALGGAVRAISR